MRIRSDRARGSAAMPRVARLAVGLLVLFFVFEAAVAAQRDSVTIDEFVGLPVGLYALQGVDFRSASMNPPFFRSFAALPLLLRGQSTPRIPPRNAINDWEMGYRFMRDYRATYQQLFVPARCMVIFASVLLGALLFEWAYRLYGYAAALVALFFFALSPNLLAHAHLVTLDVAGALGWTSVTYLTWRLFDSPTVCRAVGLGMMLGLAPALKISGLVLPIVVGLLFLVRARSEPERGQWRRWLGLLALAYVMALVVLNGLYRFEGFGQALSAIDFRSQRFLRMQHAVPWLRLPLPRPFLRSLDVLFLGDQPREPAYFFAGRWSLHGWSFYHLAAFALKTPLPLLLGGLFATGGWLAGRSKGRRDYCVFVPVLFVFLANAVLNPLNIGVRHALPVYPLLAIAVSPWFAGPLERMFSASRTRADAARAVLSVALMGWFIVANLSVAPRYLEYFNELAGGPASGHRWLIDSNIDWGQDLIRLSDYMREHRLHSVKLAYFGRVDPQIYGIDFESPVEGESHGTVVVSASFLMGRPYWIWTKPGTLDWSHHGAYTWLQRYTTTARIGELFVFDLP